MPFLLNLANSISSIQAITHAYNIFPHVRIHAVVPMPFCSSKKGFWSCKNWEWDGWDGCMGVRMYGWMRGRAFSLIVCYFIYLFIFPRLPKKMHSMHSLSFSLSLALFHPLPAIFLSFSASPYCLAYVFAFVFVSAPPLLSIPRSTSLFFQYHTPTQAHTQTFLALTVNRCPSGRGKKKRRMRRKGRRNHAWSTSMNIAYRFKSNVLTYILFSLFLLFLFALTYRPLFFFLHSYLVHGSCLFSLTLSSPLFCLFFLILVSFSHSNPNPSMSFLH